MDRDPGDPLPRHRITVRRITEREPETRAKTDDELRAMKDDLKTRLLHPLAHPRRPYLRVLPKMEDTP